MNLDLNTQLLNSLMKNLKEYLPMCKERLVRNTHMREMKDAATWVPTVGQLDTLNLLLGHFVGKFAVAYEGGNRFVAIANALVADAKKFVTARPKDAPDALLIDAALVDFLNYWSEKRGLDLALYTSDLYE